MNRSNNTGAKGVSRNGPRSRHISSGNRSGPAYVTRAWEGDILSLHDEHLHVHADQLLPGGRRLVLWAGGIPCRSRLLATVGSLSVSPKCRSAPVMPL